MKNSITILMSILVLSCGKKKEDDFYALKESGIKKSIIRGAVVYKDMCITCHLSNGQGVPMAFPPLAGSDYLEKNQDLSIKAVKYGMSGEITVNEVKYNSVMASIGLNDQEVADVMNYINKSWGNNYGKEITTEKVTKITP